MAPFFDKVTWEPIVCFLSHPQSTRMDQKNGVIVFPLDHACRLAAMLVRGFVDESTRIPAIVLSRFGGSHGFVVCWAVMLRLPNPLVTW